MLKVTVLYLIIPGRINFLLLGRYGSFGEQLYRHLLSGLKDCQSCNLDKNYFSTLTHY